MSPAGRLRAEWNPQITPALKSTYGYDGENHVTATETPGREPFIMSYGTSSRDSEPGRLLAVTRPGTLLGLGGSIAPKNLTLPTLSTTSPVIGTTLKVANGSWNNSPFGYYSYQWEDCNAEGVACHVIAGAVNQTYTPQASDSGYALVAVVTAEATGGATAASTAASSVVAMPTPTYSSVFASEGSGEGHLSKPTEMAIDASGNLWVADSGNNRIEKFSATGTFLAAYGSKGSGNEQFLTPYGVAINKSTGNVYVTDSGNHRVEEFSSTGSFLKAFGSYGTGYGQLSAPYGIAIDARGNLWVADYANNRVDEFTPEGVFMQSFGKEGSEGGFFRGPAEIAFSGENLYVTDYSNNRVQEFSKNGVYLGQFGHVGSENGQFSSPYGIATDSYSGDLYVADENNYRVQEFNPAGVFISKFGTEGGGSGQFKKPDAVAVSASGQVYVADSVNDRIEIWAPAYSTSNPAPVPPTASLGSIATIDYNVPLSGEGLPTMSKAEVEKWGQQDAPAEATAIFPPDKPEGWPAKEYARASIDYLDAQDHIVNTLAPSGAITTTEYNTNGDIVKTLTAVNRETALKEGCESKEKCKSAERAQLLSSESTYNSEGNELVHILGPQHTVELPSTSTQAQARLSTRYYYDEGAPAEGGPYHLVTKTTTGALVGSEEKEKRTTLLSYSGQNNLGWKLHRPTSSTREMGGTKLVHTVLYEPSTGDVTESRMPAAGAAGEEQGYSFQFQFGKTGTEKEQFKEPQAIAVTASRNMFVADTANNRVQEFNREGKYVRQITGLSSPKGLATDSEGDVWVADTGRNAIEEFSPEGTFMNYITLGGIKAPQGVAVDSEGHIWVANTGSSKVEEYEYIKFEEGFWTRVRSFGTEGTGETQFKEPQGITIGAEGNVYVADTANNRIKEYKPNGTLVRIIGSEGTTNGKFKAPHQITADTAGNIWVADSANNRIQELNATGTFMQTFGKEGTTEGKLKTPKGIAIDLEGNAWVADTANNRIQQWTPNGSGYETAGKATAHNTQTFYYIAGANSPITACDEHPEWANMPCQTQPAAQPANSLPKIPSTTYTYNYWDEPEKTTLTSGTSTRTTTDTYDPAGRPATTETTASSGVALPKITEEYNTETGALANQSTTVEGKTTKISVVDNKLGQMTSYTDANENKTTYEYEGEKDYRLKKTNDGKGTQTFSYDPTSGFMTKVTDSAAGVFTATDDVEGNMLSEAYPNGMSAQLTIDSTGTPTKLEYVKTTHCESGCTWYTDAVVPDINGEWGTQTSSTAKETDFYDPSGRLTEVQETPTATEKCKTRVYAYDPDTNRTAFSTYGPTVSGGCTNKEKLESTESHSFDEADRLTDASITYSAFGETTAVSSTDAGGHELTSTFYADGQLATQTQNGQTNSYTLDPSRRTSETTTGSTTTIDHYTGPGDSPAWTIEPASGHWTRYIQGVNGELAATQQGSETPILELSNLHGDIIGTAALSETESKLTLGPSTNEYGVPSTTPTKYDWLGASQRSTELPTGVIAMGARSYIPQLGRYLQTDPLEGGSANSYAYTHANPINETDLGGQATEGTPPAWAIEAGNTVENEAVQVREAEEEAARVEAERKAAEAQAAEAAYWAYWNNYTATQMALFNAEMAAENDEESGGGGGSYRKYDGFVEIGGRRYVGDLAGPNPCVEGKCHRNSGAGKWPWEVPWVKKVVGVVKEVIGIGKCAYELVKQYGAGCGNP